MKQESHSSSSSSSSPSSPTVDEMSVREREDATNSDTSPVPVSNSVDDRTGKTCGNPSQQNFQNQYKRDHDSTVKPV